MFSFTNRQPKKQSETRNFRWRRRRSTSRRLTRRLSSLVLARASPALQDSLMKLNKESVGSVAKQPTIDPVVVTSLCKQWVTQGVCCWCNRTSTCECQRLSLLLAEVIHSRLWHTCAWNVSLLCCLIRGNWRQYKAVRSIFFSVHSKLKLQ